MTGQEYRGAIERLGCPRSGPPGFSASTTPRPGAGLRPHPIPDSVVMLLRLMTLARPALRIRQRRASCWPRGRSTPSRGSRRVRTGSRCLAQSQQICDHSPALCSGPPELAPRER